MKKPSRLLWIEEDTGADLRFLVGPVVTSGRYDLSVATDVTEALERLATDRFDVVVFDLLLLPGTSTEWNTLYARSGGDKRGAQLGIELLRRLFGQTTEAPRVTRPNWLQPNRCGVLTVERPEDVEPRIGVKVGRLMRKTFELEPTALLELADSIGETGG